MTLDTRALDRIADTVLTYRAPSKVKKSKKPLTAIDLFCGAGGLSEGFRQAGFKVLVGTDFDTFAGETFVQTHKGAAFIGGPIESIPATRFLKAAKLKRGELDCLIGGPPCQAYSVYNHKRGFHDKRSHLFKEYLRLVDGLNPQWIVMENVTGILSAGNGRAVRSIIDGLQELGYHTEMRTLKAEEYGVPQERRRVFFIGNRIGAPIVWPEITHGPGLLPYVTVWDAIGDLPRLSNGEDPETPQPYRSRPFSDYQKKLRGKQRVVMNHSAPRLDKINLERMKYIGQGGSWRDLPLRLLPDGMKRAKRSDHTKRYGRLSKKGLASTIMTKCDLHWGAYIHPDQDRCLTVRDAARLQSFPDSFVFSGPRTEQYIQVGNAVPPLLGKCVAVALLHAHKTGKGAARWGVGVGQTASLPLAV